MGGKESSKTRHRQLGRANPAEMNFLIGNNQRGIGVLIARRVVIAIVVGKVGAGDVMPETMTFLEEIRRRIRADGKAFHLARLEKFGSAQPETIANADHAQG